MGGQPEPLRRARGREVSGDDQPRSVGSRSCPNRAKQGAGRALIGNRAVRRRHRVNASAWTGYPQTTVIGRSISRSRPPMFGGHGSGNAGDRQRRRHSRPDPGTEARSGARDLDVDAGHAPQASGQLEPRRRTGLARAAGQQFPLNGVSRCPSGGGRKCRWGRVRARAARARTPAPACPQPGIR